MKNTLLIVSKMIAIGDRKATIAIVIEIAIEIFVIGVMPLFLFDVFQASVYEC